VVNTIVRFLIEDNPEDLEDISGVYPNYEIVRKTENFEVILNAGAYTLRCLKDAYPKEVALESPSDAQWLIQNEDYAVDFAAVFLYSVGIYNQDGSFPSKLALKFADRAKEYGINLGENEIDPDDDPDLIKDIAGPEDAVIYSLSDMKRMVPDFFSRRANLFHRTKRIIKIDNYLITHNAGDLRDAYQIYRFENHPDQDAYLSWQGRANDLKSARTMIRNEIFPKHGR
jgi:hypothetical protein